MRYFLLTLLFALAPTVSIAHSVEESGLIEIQVDVSEQKMYVFKDNTQLYTWDVSTARKGKVTPRGVFKPQFLSKNHKSSLYNNAPMPYSIFYSGNYAIHGTYDVDKLGAPASAGCVRLDPDNAAILFEMVKSTSFSNVKIIVQD